MKLVKITPNSQRAKDIIHQNGEVMELLVDKGDSFIVRSLQDTFKQELAESVFGKWIGTFTKEEATWEEV